MKKWFIEHKKQIILSLAGTLLPALIGLLLWGRLPEQMVTHFGADAVPDGTSAKAFAVFVLPLVMAALDLLALAFTALDPGHRNQNKKALGMIFWIMPAISISVCGMMYAIALGKTAHPMMILPVMLGGLFVGIGNYLPKVKQNTTLGIKIYWTLHNEENWNKTHRFAGKCWVVGGVLMMLTAVLPTDWMLALMLLALVPLLGLPIGYSYRIYREHKVQGIDYAAPPATKEQKRIRILVVVLVLAVLIGVGVLMFTGDVTCTLGEDALTVESSFANGLALPYGEIDEIQFREDFDKGSRTMGFGSARLSLGVFESEEFPVYTLYAYNSCDAAVLIRSGQKWLAVNAKTAEETLALYEALLEKVGR